ncbi:MAG: glutamine--fructose-6-phosphate aminotransferase, partial [Thermoplasmata archaeon]|nr:glutamine--fructose-6-phosphate aminotransferase [Thermoplasmata archaeon]
MCGIVGYIGDQEASTVLLMALKKLEYRGYDSSGLAVVGEGSGLKVTRALGYISNLKGMIEPTGATIGISHTRWATHGVPSEENAHPHMDGSSSIAVVHNGIIDNHLALREELTKKGHTFSSQTDSEVVPHLIQEEYEGNGGNLLEAVRSGVGRLKGSYSIVVVHRDHPD